ncbi:MAG: hypothetical protein HY298_18425 [Verrucomicrobia bacterium]|nr:hypothetical protein [Verrucomicrobiota bacterium]
MKDFFASGTQVAWIIHPVQQCAEICHAVNKRELLAPGAFLDGENLLSGFRYAIADLFKEWDWA